MKCMLSLMSKTTPQSLPLQLLFLNSNLAELMINHVIHASGKFWDHLKLDINIIA